MSKKYTIDVLQDYATNKGGLLISTEYINSPSRLKWQCACKYVWEASWGSIINAKSWCPKCANQEKADIKQLQLFAINKGGLLVSPDYIKAINKVLWQCKEGHQWKACWNSIKNGHTWCPICSAKKQKPDILLFQEHATTKGGLLLSTEYINSGIKLDWQCKEGHQWSAFWGDIKKGTWCPCCSKLKSESECIRIAGLLFGCSFIKQRIKCIDPNNNYMFLEFDGYNENKKLAIEYNGIQHYVYPNHWHKTEEDFIYQQKRDDRKRNYCQQQGIFLIEVPYTENKTLEQFLQHYIKENELNIVV